MMLDGRFLAHATMPWAQGTRESWRFHGRYLPPEIAEHDAEESRAREPLILQLLSSTLAERTVEAGFEALC